MSAPVDGPTTPGQTAAFAFFEGSPDWLERYSANAPDWERSAEQLVGSMIAALKISAVSLVRARCEAFFETAEREARSELLATGGYGTPEQLAEKYDEDEHVEPSEFVEPCPPTDRNPRTLSELPDPTVD